MTSPRAVTVRTEVERVRVRMDGFYQSGDRLALSALRYRLDVLEGFARFSFHAAYLDADTNLDPWLIRRDVEVERLSYNSPLETILLVSSSGTAVISTGAMMVHLFNLAQEARTRRARASFQVATYELLTADVKRRAGDVGAASRSVESAVVTALQDVDKASDALAIIDEIEVLDRFEKTDEVPGPL